MALFFVMESIKIAPKTFFERKLYKPYPKLEVAKKACARAAKPDNQPFVINHKNEVVHVGPKGREYA
jgi:hypothetical protein